MDESVWRCPERTGPVPHNLGKRLSRNGPRKEILAGGRAAIEGNGTTFPTLSHRCRSLCCYSGVFRTGWRHAFLLFCCFVAFQGCVCLVHQCILHSVPPATWRVLGRPFYLGINDLKSPKYQITGQRRPARLPIAKRDTGFSRWQCKTTRRLRDKEDRTDWQACPIGCGWVY